MRKKDETSSRLDIEARGLRGWVPELHSAYFAGLRACEGILSVETQWPFAL